MIVFQVLLTVGFLLALYFPVMFYVRSDPNSNSPARSVFVFSIVVAGVLFLSMLRSYGVSLPEWMRIGAFIAIIVALAVQDFTLTKTQNRRSSRLAQERQEINQ